MANMSYLWLHEDTNETDSKSETPKVGKHSSVRQDDLCVRDRQDNRKLLVHYSFVRTLGGNERNSEIARPERKRPKQISRQKK